MSCFGMQNFSVSLRNIPFQDLLLYAFLINSPGAPYQDPQRNLLIELIRSCPLPPFSPFWGKVLQREIQRGEQHLICSAIPTPLLGVLFSLSLLYHSYFQHTSNSKKKKNRSKHDVKKPLCYQLVSGRDYGDDDGRFRSVTPSCPHPALAPSDPYPTPIVGL